MNMICLMMTMLSFELSIQKPMNKSIVVDKTNRHNKSVCDKICCNKLTKKHSTTIDDKT